MLSCVWQHGRWLLIIEINFDLGILLFVDDWVKYDATILKTEMVGVYVLGINALSSNR